MWSHPPLAAVKHNAYPDSKDPDDVHGHSPSKSNSTTNQSNTALYNVWATGRAFPVPVSQQMYPPPQVWQQAYADRWGGPPRWPGQDPCLEPAVINDAPWHHRGARSSREDIPMPDYTSSSSSSRAISGNSGMSAMSYEAPVHLNDEHYNVLIQALTPTKATTTRVSSITPSAKPLATKVGVSPTVNVKGKKERDNDNDETPKKIVKKAPVTKDPEEESTSSITEV